VVGFIGALILSGCNGGTSLNSATGHYEGFVVDSSDSVQTQTTIGADAKVGDHSLAKSKEQISST
jgi:hypothetical protein